MEEERWTGAFSFLDRILGVGASVFWRALGVRRDGRNVLSEEDESVLRILGLLHDMRVAIFCVKTLESMVR